MALTLVTPPAEDFLSLDALKQQCRVDSNDEDALLQELGRAAAEFVQAQLGKTLLTTTYRLTLAGFPRDGATPIRLPRPPVQAVQAVTYDKRDGTTATLTEGVDWTLYGAGNLLNEPACIVPLKRWPRDTANLADAVGIAFESGFSSADDVPARVRLAALALAAHWYEQREPVALGTIATEVPLHVNRLLTSARLWDAA